MSTSSQNIPFTKLAKSAKIWSPLPWVLQTLRPAHSTSSRYVLLFWTTGTREKYLVCLGTYDEQGEPGVKLRSFDPLFLVNNILNMGITGWHAFFSCWVITTFPGSVWGTYWSHSFINMGNWNTERFLSCIYIIRGLEIWGACVFGCLISDTHSLICMNIMHPELLLRSKNQHSASAKPGCWHPELEAHRFREFFKDLGWPHLVWAGHWIECKVQCCRTQSTF